VRVQHARRLAAAGGTARPHDGVGVPALDGAPHELRAARLVEVLDADLLPLGGTVLQVTLALGGDRRHAHFQAHVAQHLGAGPQVGERGTDRVEMLHQQDPWRRRQCRPRP
jgi:hypothetical protein